MSLVAVGMALFNLNLPWYAGFQPSFTSTLGLILFAGPLSNSFELLVTTHLSPVAAQLASLPTSLYVWGRLSPILPLVNLLILPTQPAVMLPGSLRAGELALGKDVLSDQFVWLFDCSQHT